MATARDAPVAAARGSHERIALWTLAIIAAMFFLRQAAQLLIPIVIGVLLSYALEPIVAWLQRHRIPRLAGASMVMIVTLGTSAWGLYALRDSVANALEALPEAARRARELILSSDGSGPTASIQQAAQVLQGEGTGEAATSAQSQPPQNGSGGLMNLVQQGVGSVFALVGHLAVIVFLVFFLLLSGHHVRDRVIEVAGPERDKRRLAASIIDDINAQVQRFLIVRLVTAVIVGLATWGVLAWMGVQNAAVWGILAGVFNSIPYFGPIIVSGGLLIVGLVQGGGPTQALQMSGAALVITGLEGWLLTPPLMGKAERMGLLVVFVGLLFWTWLWGAWGTILAVPMLAVIKSIADRVDRLKPLGRLMAP